MPRIRQWNWIVTSRLWSSHTRTMHSDVSERRCCIGSLHRWSKSSKSQQWNRARTRWKVKVVPRRLEERIDTGLLLHVSRRRCIPYASRDLSVVRSMSSLYLYDLCIVYFSSSSYFSSFIDLFVSRNSRFWIFWNIIYIWFSGIFFTLH